MTIVLESKCYENSVAPKKIQTILDPLLTVAERAQRAATSEKKAPANKENIISLTAGAAAHNTNK